jgi:hypothetical protein
MMTKRGICLALSIAMAFPVCAVSQETRGPRVRDSILGVDKLKHFLLAGFVESVAFAGLQAAGAERNVSLAGAGAATITISLGRELHDRRATGLFSVGDLVWDALGAGAAFLILARVQK